MLAGAKISGFSTAVLIGCSLLGYDYRNSALMRDSRLMDTSFLDEYTWGGGYVRSPREDPVYLDRDKASVGRWVAGGMAVVGRHQDFCSGCPDLHYWRGAA